MDPWKLWLDDQYDDCETPFRHPPQDFISAKSSKEAITLTRLFGIPEFISFDHDLGDGDDAMVYINWLTDNLYDAVVPEYVVHSANPVGKDNIISKMDSWKKSQGL